MESDFPGLLIQAQQYLLFRVDMSDMTPAANTKGQAAFSTVSICTLLLLLHIMGCVCRCCLALGPYKHQKMFLFVSILEQPLLRSEGRVSWPALPHSLPGGSGWPFIFLWRWFREGADV